VTACAPRCAGRAGSADGKSLTRREPDPDRRGAVAGTYHLDFGDKLREYLTLRPFDTYLIISRRTRVYGSGSAPDNAFRGAEIIENVTACPSSWLWQRYSTRGHLSRDHLNDTDLLSFDSYRNRPTGVKLRQRETVIRGFSMKTVLSIAAAAMLSRAQPALPRSRFCPRTATEEAYKSCAAIRARRPAQGRDGVHGHARCPKRLSTARHTTS